MKLWLLRPHDNDPAWERPSYDKAYGFVVRAATAEIAREIASRDAGDEGAAVWLDRSHSACVELTQQGSPQIVLRDFNAA